LPGTAPDTDGNQAQIRVIAKQLVEAASIEMGQRPKAEIPAPLKWGAAIFGVFITVGSMGFLFWMVSTISETQLTVTEIATRQEMTTQQWESKFKGLEDRMERLEAQQRARVVP
jgi:hypothetical protein